jgi:hypothetical protein
MPNMKFFKKNRALKRTVFVVLVLGLIILLAGGILSYYARKKAEERLASVGITLGSFQINLFTQSLSVEDLDMNFAGDSAQAVPQLAHIESITLSGISLYDLLIHNKIVINKVTLEDGNIRYNRNVEFNDSPANSNSRLKGITIHGFIIRNLRAEIAKDSLLEYSGILKNLAISTIQFSDSLGFNLSTIKIEAEIKNSVINHEGGFYQSTIGSVKISSSEKKLSVDSVLLRPNYPKYRFARRVGKQTDRFNAFIQKIDVDGLNYNDLMDSSFVASKIEITSGEVLAFRDKRMPFKETKHKPLPVAALKKLPFSVEVDTIKIRDSNITYEEFPEDGFQSGKILFANLNATISNVSNRTYYNKSKYAKLEASAKLMGRGLIEASFLLPLVENQPYHAKGKITNMSLHHLNPALENLAFVSIEEGKLNALNFNFDYNDKVSNGTLIINYENLKMKGLKKQKETIENELKTFLLNTFLKSDKDKTVPTAKRTGEISFERDTKRQVFNFWWKSLYSGIKETLKNSGSKKKK